MVRKCILGLQLLITGGLLAPSFSKDLFTLYGDVMQIALPSVALGRTLYLKDRKGSLQFAESYGSTMATTYLLKYTVNEKRPNGGKHSFPSGHTASAFSGAWFLWKRYGPEWGVPSVALASLVGFSRVHARAHYWKDVIAGAVLSGIFTLIFTRRFRAEVSGKGFTFEYSF